jgi:hypothetical protein
MPASFAVQLRAYLSLVCSASKGADHSLQIFLFPRSPPRPQYVLGMTVTMALCLGYPSLRDADSPLSFLVASSALIVSGQIYMACACEIVDTGPFGSSGTVL